MVDKKTQENHVQCWNTRRTVLYMTFNGGTIWGFAHPYVQILALARLEEEDVVAIVEIRQLIKLVKFCFRVEFCIFAAVGEEGIEIVEEMSMAVCDAAGREDQDSLSVLFDWDSVYCRCILFRGL